MFDVAVKRAQTEGVETERLNERGNLINLKGGFSTGDDTYNFELKSDGTGRIVDSECFDEFDDFLHEVEVGRLAVEIDKAVKRESLCSRMQPHLTFRKSKGWAVK